MTRTCRMLGQACLMIVAATRGGAQSADSGMFRLHKFGQEIGAERYTLTRGPGGIELNTTFRFVDRGTPVPLMATWRASPVLTSRYFAIRGSTSRSSRINDTVVVTGATATVHEDTVVRNVPVSGPMFTIAGYSPVVMQQEMLGYWDRHQRPKSLPILPSGSVNISLRGRDTVQIDGHAVVLRRYGIDGLIWGRETAWRDAAGDLVALVTVDAEFDHFEAVRDGYEAALTTFIARAAGDGAAALTVLTRSAAPASGAASPSTRAYALVGGTVIDGTGAPPLNDAVVLIRNGKIDYVGPRSQIILPHVGMPIVGRGVVQPFDPIDIIDVSGTFILPGLWDMHAHYEQVEWGPIYLAAGVTTARDVGNEFDFITGVRDAIASGRGIGPRLLLAGVIDGKGPLALGVEQADTPERGIELVDQYHAAGFQQIKIYSSMKLPVLQAVTAEAHRLGMTVTGHVPEGLTGYQGVEAGMDQINHIQYIVPMMKPPAVAGVPAPPLDTASEAAHHAIDFLKAHHTVVDPTLAIFEWEYHPARVPFSEFEPGAAKVAPQLEQALMSAGVPDAMAARGKQRFDEMMMSVGALHAAGVPIVAGTDQTVPGYSLHREIELYVRAGFTPLEAIQAATIVPARVMGLDSTSGTVTKGKRADLIVVDADPLQQIENLRRISLVIAGGRRYLPGPLWKSVGFTP